MSALRTRFFSLLAPLAFAGVLASERAAQAVLVCNIYESGPNVVIQASGSLDFSGATTEGTTVCGANGAINSRFAIICTGVDVSSDLYRISGPRSIGSGGDVLASSVNPSGESTFFDSSFIGINVGYPSGAPIVSSAVFSNATLSALGINAAGLLGTWTLDSTTDTI